MAPVSFTAAADADAAGIFDDLYAKAGKSTVVKYRAALRTLYEHLAEFPDSGAPRPKIGPNIRIGIVHPYVVIYRRTEADNTVRVLRIVYGGRKISGKLLRGVS
jgi:toxin ParE1/3/4